MENDLVRSVRFLEDALDTPTRNLFKVTPLSNKKEKKYLDLSLTIDRDSFNGLMTSDKDALRNTMNIFTDETTMTGAVVQAGTPWTTTTDNMYQEFAEILQTYSGGADMLEISAELARCCSDALLTIQTLKSKVHTSETPEDQWLEAERNNWRLLYVLYMDRLQARNQIEEDDDTFCSGVSEKNCVGLLFKKDNLIRESQLVIDWLERNASEKNEAILRQSDFTYGWEHTLHQLTAPDVIAIGSTTTVINNIHPDAPHVQKRSLHHLDLSNEKKLCQRVFAEIRCGNLEAGQELCYNSGHPWRAGLLEGWKLFHNSNLNDENKDAMEFGKDYEDVEGNSNRDLWKFNAIEYCKNKNLNIYEKAAVASLCGYLNGMLPVCNSWEDYLWAYMRTMVDIRVESEIRDHVIRSCYLPLHDEYWEQKMSISKIFQVLETMDNEKVVSESQSIDHIIQKLIILDEIPKLVELLSQWAENLDTPTQQMRFFAHLVLFFDTFGGTGDRKLAEKVLEAYIYRLSELNCTELVAFYTSKLGKRKQVVLYASHCEKILSTIERKEALRHADDNDLNIFLITQRIVESICNQPSDIIPPGGLSKKLTAADELKISALDWLTFHEDQQFELLKQTNALVFKFLTLGKIEAAHLAINKVPRSIVESLKSESDLSAEVYRVSKSFLSYRAYLDAQEAFNDWFRQFSNKPLPPADLSENAQFTEKVAHSHRVSQYNAELERWKLTSLHAAKTAKTLLYNVLLFPDMWLTGENDANYLRSVCIPEIVLLLYSVLSESGWHDEAVQLADLIAAERYGIYKAYPREKLGEILEKICESSVSLLKAKKDPWGSKSVQ